MSEITFDQIKDFQAQLAKQPAAGATARAVQNVGPQAASREPIDGEDMKPVFSLDLDTGTVANQKKSGRCWLFATLNTVRHGIADEFGIKDFEFSQNYNAFFDRLEKANLFYENILATADKPLDDREVADYLSGPDQDGGHYDQAEALIEKYGLVPKSIMPETYNSEKTVELNSVLNEKLRKDAKVLRELKQANAGDDAIAAKKREFLSVVYRILAYTFGNPPTQFDFEYRDDKKQYHRDTNLTPQSFFKKYVKWHFDDYVVVASDPEPNKKYHQLYTIASANTVVGGHPLTILNLPPDQLKKLALTQLQAGEAVWFGNDVLADMDRKSGTLKGGLYNYSDLFDLDLHFDKTDRIVTTEAEMSHAMTLTGADVVDGEVTKWKVENSWGKDNGHDGYFVADASWFDQYVYEVVVRKDLLDPDDQAALKATPINVPVWDFLN